jgi:hypothetical protein
MTRIKNKPKYKELEGDPSKSSIKALVNFSLLSLKNGGAMES